MKKIVILFSLVLMITSVSAQEKAVSSTADKNKKVAFEVDGVCMMCKARIEKAALKTKGIKYASWDVDTHQLSLIMDESKCSEMQAKKAIAAVGHDAGGVIADNEVYENLMPCCLYRSESIQEEHDQH